MRKTIKIIKMVWDKMVAITVPILSFVSLASLTIFLVGLVILVFLRNDEYVKVNEELYLCEALGEVKEGAIYER